MHIDVMNDFVKRIRERMDVLGLNESQLAKLCGTSQPTVNRLMKGEVESPSYILELATALKTTVKFLKTGMEDNNQQASGYFVPPPNQIRGEAFTAEKVPVYGLASGQNDERIILNDNFIVEWVPVPTELRGVRGGFRMYVHGDSMEPRHYQGELVSIHPYKRPSVGDDILIVKDDGSTMLKRYMGETAKDLLLMQYNPHKDFKLAKAEVRSFFAVVR